MEERAPYLAGQQKPPTYRDLRSWLDRLRPDQLDAPALVVMGAAVFVVAELAASDLAEDGPVLLVEKREDLHGGEV